MTANQEGNNLKKLYFISLLSCTTVRKTAMISILSYSCNSSDTGKLNEVVFKPLPVRKELYH